MRRAFLTLLFVLCASSMLPAEPSKKVLVYYFKNISGEDQYSDLMYKLPVCIYTNMKEGIEGSKYSVIDTEGLERYSQDSAYDLWDSGLLLEVAQQRGITEVIYGQFYVEAGKPVLFGKVYFIQNGLILDIGEDRGEYNEVFREVETLTVEQVRAYDIEKKTQVYKPGMRRIVEKEVTRVHNNVSVSGGVVFPVFEWSDLFPVGISGELSYTIFPKIEVFPLGFGLHTGFLYFARYADEYYTDSELFLFPVGVQVRYIVKFKGFVDGLSADFSVGGCFSRLFVEDILSTSADPYIKAGINLILNPIKDHYVSMKFGYMNVAYKDTPLNILSGELGIIFYF